MKDLLYAIKSIGDDCEILEKPELKKINDIFYNDVFIPKIAEYVETVKGEEYMWEHINKLFEIGGIIKGFRPRNRRYLEGCQVSIDYFNKYYKDKTYKELSFLYDEEVENVKKEMVNSSVVEDEI